MSRAATGRIPQLATNVVLRHKYRFTLVTGDNTPAKFNVDQLQLLLTAGSAGTSTGTSGTVQSMFEAVRIVSVEAWNCGVPGNTYPVSTTIALSWLGAYGSSTEVSDTTMSVAEPAHIHARPPPRSSAAFWTPAGASVPLFSLTASSGAVVDIDLELVLSDTTSTGIVPPTYSSGGPTVIGTVYYVVIPSTGSASLEPVALNSLS